MVQTAITQSNLSTVHKILLMQVGVIVVVSIGFLIGSTSSATLSSLSGGLIAFLPNLYFAYRMSLAKGRSAQKIVRTFYGSESTKILLTCGLFAIAFQLPKIQFLPLMVCFIAVLCVFWLALILFAQDFKV